MKGRPLDILLPWKEKFQDGQAGAVALCVRDAVAGSRFRDSIRVLGPYVEHPFPGFHYRAVERRHRLFLGHNSSMAAGYLHAVRQEQPALVEVHNRPLVAARVAAKRPDIPILLYLHNDPKAIEGSRTPEQRRVLAEYCAGIICVSDYIRRCFRDGLPDSLVSKLHVVIPGVARPRKTLPHKEPLIVFAGRMNSKKGAREFAQAVTKVLPRHREWSVILAGARWFGNNIPTTPYERDVREILAPLRQRACATGYISHSEVMALYDRASIAVIPSIWQEPLGRTAVEALAAGCAVIASRRGGLPEVVEGRGVLLEEPTTESIASEIERLIADAAYREELQQQAWNDYPFTVEAMSERLDTIMASLLSDSFAQR